MDYIKLGVEILTDPAGMGYDGKSNQECADLMNDKTRTKTVRVAKTKITEYLMTTVNKWTPISQANVADSTSNSGDFILALNDVTSQGDGTFDIDSQMATDFLDGLVTDGKIDAADKTAIVAMGSELIARVVELGLGNRMSQGAVEIVRSTGQPRVPLLT